MSWHVVFLRITRYTILMTQTPDINPTTDWLGRTYIQRWDTTKQWLIRYVEPCNEWYYRMTGADPTIPRWEVTVQRLRNDGTLGKKVTSFALTADAEIVR